MVPHYHIQKLLHVNLLFEYTIFEKIQFQHLFYKLVKCFVIKPHKEGSFLRLLTRLQGHVDFSYFHVLGLSLVNACRSILLKHHMLIFEYTYDGINNTNIIILIHILKLILTLLYSIVYSNWPYSDKKQNRDKKAQFWKCKNIYIKEQKYVIY